MTDVYNKIKELVAAAAKSEAAEQAKAIAATALTKVKDQINDALDAAIESIKGTIKESAPDTEGAPVIEQTFKPKRPGRPPKKNGKVIPVFSHRIRKWVESIKEEDRGYYLDLFKAGKIHVSEDETINGPGFYVKPNSNEIILTGRKNSKGFHRQRCIERCTNIYRSYEDAKKTGATDEQIFYCRVTIPNAYTRDHHFPVLYIVDKEDDVNILAVKATYADYIKKEKNMYCTAMSEHATDPRNRRHTSWRVNVQACPMSRTPREKKKSVA